MLSLKPKNLVVDLGNTKAKIAFFSRGELLQKSEKLTEREIIQITKREKPKTVLVSSVRKGLPRFVMEMSKHAKTMVLDHTVNLPFRIVYQTPHTLGADRIAAVAGAMHLFPNKNCLVIDLGTCITYDFLDFEGNYQGGAISPGIDIRLKSLHKFTAKLPNIAFAGPASLVGKTTRESMLSGVVNGTLAEVEGFIERYQKLFGDLVIIVCGGNTKFFETNLKDSIFAIPDLVLTGLNQILRFNGQIN